MFKYYHERLKKLFEKYKLLERISPKSVFPCAAVDFGPRVCAYGHRDHLNCPFGFCAIQPFGHFDSTHGVMKSFGRRRSLWNYLPIGLCLSSLPPSPMEIPLSATTKPGCRSHNFAQKFAHGGCYVLSTTKCALKRSSRLKTLKATWEKGVKKLSKYDDVVVEVRFRRQY